MKKNTFLFFALLLLMTSCMTVKETPAYGEPLKYASESNQDIIQSLFDDKDAKISEENIQKILD